MKGLKKSRCPRAYARGTWDLKPAIQLDFARIDFLLTLHLSLDDVCVDPDRGGETTDGPTCVPPVYLLAPGKTLAHRSTRLGFALAHHGRHGIRGGHHDHQRQRIDLATHRLDGHGRVAPRNLAYAFFQVRLACTLQDLLTRRGAPTNMGRMVVGAVGTALELHTHLVSKPANENRRPAAAGFHPRANARGLQPDF